MRDLNAKTGIPDNTELTPLIRVGGPGKMKKLITLALLALFAALGGVSNLAAQDLVIANARIIVGNGSVINQGSIVIRGGKLATVSAAAANVPGVQTIDARGMTAMPGFID